MTEGPFRKAEPPDEDAEPSRKDALVTIIDALDPFDGRDVYNLLRAAAEFYDVGLADDDDSAEDEP